METTKIEASITTTLSKLKANIKGYNSIFKRIEYRGKIELKA